MCFQCVSPWRLFRGLEFQAALAKWTQRLSRLAVAGRWQQAWPRSTNMGVPEIRGTLFLGSYNMDPTM